MFINRWKEVLGSNGKYYVSNTGQVISTTMRVNSPGGSRVRKGKLLHPKSLPKGYRMVDLTIDGNTTRYYVHRLVWEAFNGRISDGLVINHLDCVPWHDWLSNLEVCTQKENNNYGDHNRKLSESLTMPVEEMVKRVHEIWPTLDYVSGFKNTIVNCLFKCQICGAITSIRPANIFFNHMGCTPCSNRRLGDLKRHSIKDAQNIMDKVYKGNITVLPEDFNGTDDKCIFRCNNCGSVFDRVYGEEQRRNGSGCANCDRLDKLSKQFDKAKAKIKSKFNGNIVFTDTQYLGSHELAHFKCLACGAEFTKTYHAESALSGNGHPKCPMRKDKNADL